MSSERSQPKPSLLQRLRQLVARPRGGDVIVANVGQGASDVVVGKNILKIGTLVIPALPAVIALIASLAGGAGGLWLYLVPAKMPPGHFNVAIAEFGVIDAQGRERITADSRLVSRTLFTTIQGELASLPPDYPALVWHDSMSFLQKRTTIGAIAGATPAQRSPVACQRATTLGADLIVYGVIDQREQPAQLRLELCARNPNRERDLGTLDELQRVDRLGSPLPVALPLKDIQSSINPPLRVRTALVAKLVTGLRYEMASNPNYQFSLRQALKTFAGAKEYLEGQDGIMSGDNGGDIVEYFIGRESFLLAQDSGTPASDRPARLESARAAFASAVELNSRFARARSALGNVYFQQAQQVPLERRQAIPQFGLAIDAFSAAIPLAQADEDRPAEAEARLSLALTYRLQAESLLLPPENVALSEKLLSQAKQEADATVALLAPEQNRLRGVTAMARGLIAHQRAQIRLRAGDKPAALTFFRQARDDYGQCIAASQADPGDQFLKRQIVDVTCVPKQTSVSDAVRRLQT